MAHDTLDVPDLSELDDLNNDPNLPLDLPPLPAFGEYDIKLDIPKQASSITEKISDPVSQKISSPPLWEDVSNSDQYSKYNEKQKIQFREYWIAHASAFTKENWGGDKKFDENEFHQSMNEFFPERKLTLGNSFKDLLTAVPDLKHHFQNYFASLETYQDLAKKETYKTRRYSEGSKYWHFNNWSKNEPRNENEVAIQDQVKIYSENMKEWGEILNEKRKAYIEEFGRNDRLFSLKHISIDKLLNSEDAEAYENDLKKYDRWRNMWASTRVPGKGQIPTESTFETLGLDFSTFEGEGFWQKKSKEDTLSDKAFQEKAFRQAKRSWYHPTRVMNMLSESVPHMAGLVVTGAINPAVAYQLSYATSTANAYDAYNDLPEEERIKKAKIVGALTALTEVAMVGRYLKMFKGKNKSAMEFLKSAALEGGQEGLQEFIQIAVKRDDESFIDIISDGKVQDRLIEAIGSGAILGGVMQGMGNAYNTARDTFGTSNDLSPEFLKKILHSMSKNSELTNDILNKESMGLADYNKLIGDGEQTNRKDRAKIFAVMQAWHIRTEIQDSQDLMEQQESEQELEDMLPVIEIEEGVVEDIFPEIKEDKVVEVTEDKEAEKVEVKEDEDIVISEKTDTKKIIKVKPDKGVEAAETDAEILKEIWSENIISDKNSNFVTANNRDFNNEFLNKIDQAGDLKTSKGKINKKAFNDRMRGAILSSVIGTSEKNRPVLIDLMENADTLGINSEVNGLIQSGMNLLNAAEEFNIQDNIADAYKILIDYKKQKLEGNVKSVADYLNQETDFIEEFSEDADLIFQQLAKRGKSAKAVKEYFNRYVELTKQHDTTTEGLFDEDLPDPTELLEKADAVRQKELDFDQVEKVKESTKKPEAKAKVPDGRRKAKAKKIKETKAMPDIKAMPAKGTYPQATSIPMNKAFEGPVDKKAKMSDIVKEVKNMGITVRQGKFTERAIGIYKNKSNVIRLAIDQDVYVLSHEVGHALSEQLDIKPEVQNQFANELVSLGEKTSKPDYTLGQKLEEGVAEFFRELVLDERNAYKMAPNFYRYFHGIIEAHHDQRYNESVKEIKRLFKGIQSQNALERVMSRTQWDPDKTKKFSMYKFMKSWLDDDFILKIADKEIGAFGDGLWDLKGLMYGSSEIAANAWKNGIRLSNGKLLLGKDGKSVRIEPLFLEIVKAGRQEEFNAYVQSVRVVGDLAGRGINTGITVEEANEAIKIAEKIEPRLEGWRQTMAEYHDMILVWLVHEGVHTQKEADLMKKKNLFYVPMNKVRETEEYGSASGFTSSTMKKRIRGSGLDTENILSNMIKNLVDSSRAVARKKFDYELIRFSKVKGAGKWIEKIPKPPQIKQEHRLSDFIKEINDSGWSLETDNEAEAIALEEVILNSYNVTGKYKSADNIITLIDKSGKRGYYKLGNSDFRDSVLNLKGEQSTELSALMLPTSILRDTATLSMGFFVRNIVMDPFTAAIQSEDGFSLLTGMVKGLFHIIKNTEEYQQYRASGAGQAQFMSSDRLTINRMLKKLKPKKLSEIPKDVITHPLEAARSFIDILAHGSNVAESATNVGLFVHVFSQKRGEGLSEEAAMTYAAIRTRRLKTDYSRGGTMSKKISKVSAFFNAGLQGQKAIYDAYKRDPLGFTFRVTKYIVMPALASWAMVHDDDEYKKLSTNDKKRFFHLPLPKAAQEAIGMETKFIRIPKPRGYDVFANYAFSLFDTAAGEDINFSKKIKEDVFEYGKDGLISAIMFNAFKPIFETNMNYNLYSKRNIVSKFLDGVPDSERYNAWTSQTSISLAKNMSKAGIEVSPAYIDHWVNGYFSNWGRAGLSVTDNLLGDKREAPKRPLVHKIPGLQVFFQPHARSRMDKLAELYESNTQLNDAKKKLKQKHADKEYLKDKYKDVLKNESTIKRNIKYVNSQMRLLKSVYENDRLSGEEKNKAIIKHYDNIFKKISK